MNVPEKRPLRTESGLRPTEEAKMEIRAIKEGWPVPLAAKQRIISNIVAIADGTKDEVTPQISVAAFKALLEADRLSMQQKTGNNVQINISHGPDGIAGTIANDDVMDLIDDLTEQ